MLEGWTRVVTVLSSLAFNRDPDAAMAAAHGGPVFVVDDGRPTYVLLSIDHYQELSARTLSLADALAQSTDFDFEPMTLRDFSSGLPI